MSLVPPDPPSPESESRERYFREVTTIVGENIIIFLSDIIVPLRIILTNFVINVMLFLFGQLFFGLIKFTVDLGDNIIKELISSTNYITLIVCLLVFIKNSIFEVSQLKTDTKVDYWRKQRHNQKYKNKKISEK